MKNVWVSFCCAMFFGVAFFALVKNRKLVAQERSPASASGLNSSIPLSREMEAALERKKSKLDHQERELKIQEERLNEAQVAVDKKIAELESLLKQKDTFEKERSRLASEDFSKLVKTYEKMPPKKAADILSTLDDKTAIDILQRLKDKALAAVLSAMPAERATNLTTELVKRSPASGGKF